MKIVPTLSNVCTRPLCRQDSEIETMYIPYPSSDQRTSFIRLFRLLTVCSALVDWSFTCWSNLFQGDVGVSNSCNERETLVTVEGAVRTAKIYSPGANVLEVVFPVPRPIAEPLVWTEVEALLAKKTSPWPWMWAVRNMSEQRNDSFFIP